MILNKTSLSSLNRNRVTLPNNEIFELPEKVLQFGTGVLLRGLPDFFIDKANRQGIFNGRIVVVKSTDHGSTKEFDEQDSLYTLAIKGVENGKTIEENIISSAISRVLVASKQWDQILNIASSKDLEVIISNTTEVGIQLVEDNVHANPPVSFPGKLLAVLFHRFKVFNGAADKGLVIVPTELIVDNGTKLADILLKLAKKNNLSSTFITWMKDHNEICNSLVDCIVPGKPANEELSKLEEELGYKDELLIMSEVYRLWAISGDEKTKAKLAFAAADSGIVITPDIDLHRELKLRLLNGTHTLSCGLAFLAGCDTVKSGMDDPAIEGFVSNLMRTEIAPAIPYDVTKEQTDEFAFKVLDRFRNPHIKHQWLSITANYSSKLKMRVVPVLLHYVELFHSVPEFMAMGFAAYIRFMKPASKNGDKYYGENGVEKYLINDTKADHLASLWNKHPNDIVEAILGDTVLWGIELSAIPGFSKAVKNYLTAMDDQKMIKEIITKEINKIEA
ncbi:MAG: tagaturonate reductase [Pelobium sp.]